jgi:Fe-S-cluster containining protein
MSFCQDKNCSHCCIEADVPLLQEDIDRITSLGYYDVYFATDYQGAKFMRKLNGKCIFYQQNKCEIENWRPKRCKFYPLTYDEKTKSVLVQDFCKYRSEFEINQTEFKHMDAFIDQLKKEIDMRLNYSPRKNQPSRINERIKVIK